MPRIIFEILRPDFPRRTEEIRSVSINHGKLGTLPYGIFFAAFVAPDMVKISGIKVGSMHSFYRDPGPHPISDRHS